MTRSVCNVMRAGLVLLAAGAGVARAEQATNSGGSEQVRRIELPRFQSNLPEGAGREAFAAACLSCHSTTYITMQPPLSAAKWEETVVKMTKVYAAPIQPEQIPQIVQYVLAATKAAGASAFQEARTLAPAVAIPQVALSREPEQRKADAKRGEALFATNCASCHGATGAGDGASAATQLPHPTNLRTTRFSTAALAAAIARGVPATAMPGFPDLSADDLRALVTFSQDLFDAGASAASPALPAEADQAEAKLLYAQNCAACHGATGTGDGPLAATSPRPPANFRLIQPSRVAAEKIIADGVPATTMPPWKHKLNDNQRTALADYVRSLFNEEPSRLGGGTERR